MKRSIFASIFAAGALLSGSALAQNAVGIATSSAGSFYHTMGSVMAATLAEKNNIQMRVQPFASPNIHLPAVNAFSKGQPENGANLADELERIVALHGAETIAAVRAARAAGENR